MDLLEDRAGFPIAFERNPAPPDASLADPLAWETQFSEAHATIRSHNFDSVDARGATHELLHIHRAWVEGIPQLRPVKAEPTLENFRACSLIENDLEHLIVVPREKDYGFDSAAYWNDTAKNFWDNYPWPLVPRPAGRRNNALLARLTLELASDPAIWAQAKECLVAEGLYAEAERFAGRIKEFLPNKPRAVACALRFLKFPREYFCLVYLDVAHRARREEPIPAH